METSATIESASLFEIDQNRRLYEFYLGWYLKGTVFFVALAAALAKLALDSGFHRRTFLAAGAAWSLLLLAPLACGFMYERRQSMAFGRLAALTGTDPISTAPFRLVLSLVAAIWVGIGASWVALWLNVL
jgi:hypothetical protein